VAKGNEILTTLLFSIESNTYKLEQGLNKTSSDVQSFSQKITKMAGALAGAFAVKQVLDFGFEVGRLAIEAEGTTSAFSKLENSTHLLNELRRATEGTVSDLQLMKLGVQGLNNQVPLERMGELLAFADKTSDSLGLNFEEVASKLVTAIGKNSTKGLQEFGLNMEDIQTKAKQLGFIPALFDEIKRKSVELGDLTNKNSDSVDRATTSWNNFKLSIGKFITQGETLSDVLDLGSLLLNPDRGPTAGEIETLTRALHFFNEERLKAIAAGNREDEVFAIKQIADLSSRLGLIKDKAVEYKDEGIKPLAKETENIANLTKQLNDLREQELSLTGQALYANQIETEGIEKKIDALKNYALYKRADAIDARLNLGNVKNEDIDKPKKLTGSDFLKDLGVDTDFATKRTQRLTEAQKELEKQTKKLSTQTYTYGKVSENTGEVASAALAGIGNVLASIVVQQKRGYTELGRVVIETVKRIIQALLVETIAKVFSKEVSEKGYVGIITGAIAGLAVSAFFNSLPAFKSGGNYTGSGNSGTGVSVVGESGIELFSSASSGRIINNSETKDLLNSIGGNERIKLEVETVAIKNDYIYLSFKEAERRRGIS
jgi:hypothetical protein